MPAGVRCLFTGNPRALAAIVLPEMRCYPPTMGAVTPVKLDVNGLFEHVCGERGLARAEVDAVAPHVRTVVENLATRRASGELPFYELPYDEESISALCGLAGELQEGFGRLVVLGIGGSALGTKAVLDAIPAPYRQAGGIEVLVLDNIDPATVAPVLDPSLLGRTVFNVISKSGGTAETLAQFLTVREHLRRCVGETWRNHLVVTTDARRGPLRALVEQEGLRSVDVPDGVGGRFSVLSAVGLLPLATAGIDIGRLCAGARAADAYCRRSNPWLNPAALHAALLYLAQRDHGRNIHVLMPYSDGLLRLAEWYGQLWGESLGKRYGAGGELLETGQTPVRALGATDQHSQVQLYMEGPHDKVITFIRVENHREDFEIPPSEDSPDEFAYLEGHTLGRLLNTEQTATELALAQAGRPSSTFVIEEIDEAALGQLFHILEVQTLVTGGLLGVNPLDQPGVEAGKALTRALAGKDGSEAEAARAEAWLKRKRGDLVIG